MTIGMGDLSEQRWIQRYLAKLDGREVLTRYGAQNVSEQPGENGTTELIHSCLIERVEPHHTHGDANPSAALNVEKRFYICYANGWHGNLFHLIMKLEGKESFSDALLSASELIHAGPDDPAVFEAELAKILDTPEAYSGDLPTYSDATLNGFLHPGLHPYLLERGITEEAADFLKLGFDTRENRVVFPHFFREHLVGFQKRVVPTKIGDEGYLGTDPPYPKYRSSSGFPKAETLYGYDFCRSCMDVMKIPVRPIVVESPMSVAKAYSLNLPFVVATFGAKVSKVQLLLLQDFEHITVWFDADEAGRAGERRIVESMPNLSKVSVVTPDEGTDLADYESLLEVQQKLATAVPGFLKRAEYETAELRGAMR